MQRLRFSANSDGSSAYTVPINPIEVDLVDNYQQEYYTVIDGATVIQRAAVDDRPRKLTWGRFRKSHTIFSAMVTHLSTFKGLIRYVAFGSIDYRIHIATTWNKFRVADVIVSVQDAARTGTLKYDKVEVILLPSN